jgi:hypothetical protein
MRIDPTKTWRAVEARLARERDPRRRKNLEVVLAHMKAEAAPDLDVLMATVAEMFEARMAVFRPIDADGLVVGEETYTGGDGFAGIAARKLGRAEEGIAG